MKQGNLEIERYRLTAVRLKRKRLNRQLATDSSWGNNGMFLIPHREGSIVCRVSDGGGWEHVSVSIFKRDRCPTWEEMCLVKDLFWADDEVVIQYHPEKSQYISNHDYCLHLWKPIDVDLPTPPAIFVGLQKGVTH